jgi:MFS family permease
VKLDMSVGSPTTEAGVRWRFLLLTGLRWLPVGFLAPVLVLIALSRGLSLPEVGVVFACYGATTALLELPTGGLADALGRKIILACSSLLHLLFLALLLVATDLGLWVVAAAVGGVARALDSGPLEAWYVDEARRLQPGVALRPGLSAAGVVEGAGLALSALAGGLLPAVLTGGSLSVVVWAALGVQVVHLVAVLLLMPEHRRADQRERGRTWRGSVAQVPLVVRDGVCLGLRRGPVRMLLLTTVVWGIALSGIEILWQPRFVTLLGGDPEEVAVDGNAQTVLLGALIAGAFLLAAVGSFLTPTFTRLLGGSASRGALVTTLLHGTAYAVLAASYAVVPAAMAFLAFYLVNGLRGPLHNELLHEHVGAERRSTMLSAESLTLQAGGFTCTLALPAVAAAVGIPWAWAGVAALLAASALFYLVVPDRPGAAGPLLADTPPETVVLP